MAVACVLVVGVVGGAVGGIYYRARRKENPDANEYAPYEPARDLSSVESAVTREMMPRLAKLNFTTTNRPSRRSFPVTRPLASAIESEDEECADDENNYSVYECPGLAPTGDIKEMPGLPLKNQRFSYANCDNVFSGLLRSSNEYNEMPIFIPSFQIHNPNFGQQ
ncbi:unnamed protein product, partial [Mesorhabditis spiculigera]